MRDSDLTKLRRARARIHMQLRKLEPLLADYHAKLVVIEAAIQAIAPELQLHPRRYAPNPHFKRGELPRLAMTIMREAGKPLAVRHIAAQALARVGVPLPDPHTLKRTRTLLQQMFSAMGKRGMVVRVGTGREAKRALALESDSELMWNELSA
jgi:hypothetical protein